MNSPSLSATLACSLLLAAFSSTPALAERVALVIGNGAYPVKKLPNPANDASLITRSLRQAGFRVQDHTDLDLKGFRDAVREFAKNLKSGDEALVYYAGHGAQAGGENYLIPVDAPLDMQEFEVEDRCYKARLALGAMEQQGARLNVLVLDCCRDNPFTRSWARSASGGMAEMKAPQETLIAYATAPGQVALDGRGANSPYTAALATEILRPGVKIQDVFLNVARQVNQVTGGKQRPWTASDLLSEFYFLPGGGVQPPMPQPLTPPQEQNDDYTLLAGRSAGERRMVEVAPGVSIPFRWCPAGSFTMGSPASEQAAVKASGFEFDVSDEAQHRVTFSKGFWLAETELTQGQWQAVMKTSLVEQARAAIMDDTLYQLGGKKQTWRDWAGDTKQTDPASRVGAQSEKIAMYFMNHFEAEEWCEKASRHAGLRGWAIALPTEAQWEYACRAGTGGMTYAGDFSIKGKNNAPGLDGIAWYGGNSSVGYSGTGWDTAGWPEKQYPGGRAGPRRVGSKSANEWGLHDMMGNVWEWCADWYGAYTGDTTDPRGPATGAYRVNRGGSWNNDAASCRAAYRVGDEPGLRNDLLGFRPALVPSR